MLLTTVGYKDITQSRNYRFRVMTGEGWSWILTTTTVQPCMELTLVNDEVITLPSDRVVSVDDGVITKSVRIANIKARMKLNRISDEVQPFAFINAPNYADTKSQLVDLLVHGKCKRGGACSTHIVVELSEHESGFVVNDTVYSVDTLHEIVWNMRDLGFKISIANKTRYRRENQSGITTVNTLELTAGADILNHLKSDICNHVLAPEWAFTDSQPFGEPNFDCEEPYIVIKKVRSVEASALNTDLPYVAWRVMLNTESMQDGQEH